MAHSFLDTVLRGAEALAAGDGVGSLADPDLLRRFATDRDQAAFAVLVRRHGPLVWGVCRTLLAADVDAEDAFQATFLALVRSAGTVRRTDALGGWLHGVAYRVAMKARRSAARRKKRELVAAVPEPDRPVPDTAWNDLQAAVHEEVCRLPEKLRLPFVLCDLQGRQQKDVARQLGWKIGTLSGRLTQARQRLLDRLARRGVPVGMAAGAAALGLASGLAAVPRSVGVKALSAAASPDAVSPIVTSLARGMTTMYLTRTKMLVAAVLLAGTFSIGIGSRHLPSAEAQAPPPDPHAEAVKKAIDFLRAHPAQDPWEYKFVPVEKPLSVPDLQKILSASDREGWQYCGSQDLVSGNLTGDPRAVAKATPHMVFKRLRQLAGTADAQSVAAGLAALAAAQEQMAREADYARRIAQAEKAFRDAAELTDPKKADAFKKDLAEAERSFREAMELTDPKKKAAKTERETAEAEKVRADLEARIQRQLADKARADAEAERDRASQMEKMLRQLMAEQQALTNKLMELEKAGRPAVGAAAFVPAPQTTSLVLGLKHVRAEDALKLLNEAAAKETCKASLSPPSNAIMIQGPSEGVARLKELVEKTIDKKPADSVLAPPGSVEIAVIPLRHIDTKAASDAISKALPRTRAAITGQSATNSLIVAGTAADVTAVRKVIEAADRAPATPRK